MIVISFSGKAGAGKDTAANALMDRMVLDGLRIQRLSFAGKLKDACTVMFGWDRARLESDPFYKEGGLGGYVPKDKPGSITITREQLQERYGMERIAGGDSADWFMNWVELDIDPYCVSLGKTRRVIMQQFGTECMRNGMDKDFWIKLIQADINAGKYSDVDVGIISDARFGNELEFTKTNNGFTILIERVDANTLTQHGGHASEQEWVTYGNQYGWGLIVSNDITAGVEALKNRVVLDVYTEMVRNGMRNFGFDVQKRIIEGSHFGISASSNRFGVLNTGIFDPSNNFPDIITGSIVKREQVIEKISAPEPVAVPPLGILSRALHRHLPTPHQEEVDVARELRKRLNKIIGAE